MSFRHVLARMPHSQERQQPTLGRWNVVAARNPSLTAILMAPRTNGPNHIVASGHQRLTLELVYSAAGVQRLNILIAAESTEHGRAIWHTAWNGM